MDSHDIDKFESAPTKNGEWVNSESRVEAMLCIATNLVNLVTHEDAHNWRKFYNFSYVNIGLLGAIAFSLRGGVQLLHTGGPQVAVMVLAVLGCALCYGFWHQLKSGVNCLEGHKRALTEIEHALTSTEVQLAYILCGRNDQEQPSRALLRWAPFVMGIFWLGVLVVTVIWFDSSKRLTLMGPGSPG